MRAPIRYTRTGKLKRCLYKLIDNNGLVIVAALAMLGIVFVEVWSGCFDCDDLNIVPVLFEVAVLGAIGWVAFVLKPVVLNRLEDGVKLADDHNALIDYYLPKGASAETARFVVFNNSSSEERNLKQLRKKRRDLVKGCTSCGTIDQTVFPVVAEHVFSGLPASEILVHDSQRAYELPAVIQSYYRDILSAHQTSRLYNQLAIRVANWKSSDGGFEITVDRTTYFDSMVTNRAMDFFFGDVTVRDLIAFGPVVSPLNSSKLSNHLGINAFLATSDKYFPLVERRKDPSIGKRRYGVGVNAMLEGHLALNEASGMMDSEGVLRAVIWAIEKELKVNQKELEGIPIILAAYRDLLEGGKPQLLMLARSALDRDALNRRYSESASEGDLAASSASNEILKDGESLTWVSADDLAKAAIAPDALYCSGRRYPMFPSDSASVALLLNSGALEGW